MTAQMLNVLAPNRIRQRPRIAMISGVFRMAGIRVLRMNGWSGIFRKYPAAACSAMILRWHPGAPPSGAPAVPARCTRSLQAAGLWRPFWNQPRLDATDECDNDNPLLAPRLFLSSCRCAPGRAVRSWRGRKNPCSQWRDALPPETSRKSFEWTRLGSVISSDRRPSPAGRVDNRIPPRAPSAVPGGLRPVRRSSAGPCGAAPENRGVSPSTRRRPRRWR
jgi:hypothetical protein